jgi:hypothetical protein
MKKIALLLLSGAATCLLSAGCTVYESTEPAVVQEESYQPMYYEGNVVYYDDVGAPFVWIDGRIVYVAHSYVHYDALVTHYHRHNRGYHRWERAHPYVHRSRRD